MIDDTIVFRSLGIPILSRLARQEGNSGKLVAAKKLLRVIAPLFKGLQIVLLMDSWYMRCTLISYALDHGLQVIGQVRRDTALFHQPERTGKRGRPRMPTQKNRCSERAQHVQAQKRGIRPAARHTLEESIRRGTDRT